MMEKLQKKFCDEQSYPCALTGDDEKVGFALATLGRKPVNGLRHPRKDNTSGWYIWCGEQYSQDPDFFSPLHAKHLKEKCPEIIKLLGLPPGYRFLLAHDYLDVWFDASLLIEEINEEGLD